MKNDSQNNRETKCDLCKREYTFLIPKNSNKKGFKGWKMVCRVCYDRLSEYDKE